MTKLILIIVLTLAYSISLSEAGVYVVSVRFWIITVFVLALIWVQYIS